MDLRRGGCGRGHEGADDNAVLNVGSVSKVVTAWGVMRLVETGRLHLDAAIGDSLTRWKLPPSELDAGGVTIRRILRHTAGLSLRGYPGFPSPQELPTIEQSLSGATNGRGDVRLVYEPGSRFEYSGGGYSLLQLLIEEVTGTDFASFMKTTILAPLGMSDAEFGVSESDSRLLASPHDEEGRPIPREYFTALAAAGLEASVSDLAKFAAATVAQTVEETGNVLRPETIRSMLAAEGPGPYGLGYLTMELMGLSVLGHSGTNTGWEAAFFVDPASRDGLVVLTNGANGQRVGRPLFGQWARAVQQRAP